MKIKYLVIASLMLCSNYLFAQSYKGDASDLYIPSSPGFILMDKAPSSIEKPTTPKAFGASLLNLAQGGAVQTFNISVATVKNDSNYSYALGAKTQVLRFYSKKSKDKIKQNVKSIKTDIVPEGDLIFKISDDSTNVANLTNSLASATESTKTQILANIANAKKTMDDDIESLRKDTAATNKKLKDYHKLLNRPFFVMELAGAIVGNTPNTPFSNTSQLSVNKSGAWANFRFSPDDCPLDFVGVARYTFSTYKTKETNTDSSFVDYGVALFYSNTKFDISAEYLNRYDQSAKKNYDRLAFAVNYKLSDKIVFVGSFGKNFDNVENLFAIVGVHFGISGTSQNIGSPPSSTSE